MSDSNIRRYESSMDNAAEQQLARDAWGIDAETAGEVSWLDMIETTDDE
jgi:hypothetical protein